MQSIKIVPVVTAASIRSRCSMTMMLQVAPAQPVIDKQQQI
jgi:hypothetical protein